MYVYKQDKTMLFSILIIKRNASFAQNQHIRMITEWSCDTEDWSNDTKNFSFAIT